MTYEHPWYTQLKLLENTTTSELESTQKPQQEIAGQKRIKKCALCKRWDDASTMYYNQRNGFYRHECNKISGKNNRKTKSQLSDSAPKRFVHPVIGKCKYCKGFDLKNNLNRTTKTQHPVWTELNSKTQQK